MAPEAAVPEAPAPPRLLLIVAALFLRIALFSLLYETVLVWLEVYGYSLTRRSSACVFLNPILAIGFTLVLVKLYLRSFRKGRMTNPDLRMAIVLAGGVTALYLAWSFDRWLRLGPMGNESAGWTPAPGPMVDHLRRFWEVGYWGWGWAWFYDRATIKGDILILWWILEAALIVGVPALLVEWIFRARAFCHRCAGWLDRTPNVHRMQESRAERIQSRILAGDFSVVEEPRGPLGQDRLSIQFDLEMCPACRDTALLTVTLNGRVLIWRLPIGMDQARRVAGAGNPKLKRLA